MVRIITSICLVVCLVVLPLGSAFAAYGTMDQPATTESMIGDAIAARPLGLISMAVGTVFFVVSLPFSALGGNTGEAAQKMVVAPTKFTFQRPLGEF